jgi:DNA-directed RNA polymerase subunit beta
MKASFTSRKRYRKSFGKNTLITSMPNLIEVQRISYDSFLQFNVSSDKRENKGLQQVFTSIFPIEDPSGLATIEFVKYEFGDPFRRGGNYSAPLKTTLRLIVWEVDEDTATREVKGIKEQEVYMGDIPLMTDKGTFVVNGTERVVVSQMHRSPGVFFDHDKGKTHASGKYLYSARVIPYRGSWLDFEFDGKDILFFRIDRKRKLPASSILYALGMSIQEILDTFYEKLEYTKKGDKWVTNFDVEALKGVKLNHDLVNAENNEVLLESGKKLTARLAKKFKEEGLNQYIVNSDDLIGRFIAGDFVDDTSGEVIFNACRELSEEDVNLIQNLGVKSIKVLAIDKVRVGPYIRNTIISDKSQCKEDALIEIYKVLRPGEPPTIEAAEILFKSLFFDADRYDLSEVGRVKLNAKLNLNPDNQANILSKDDIIEIVRTLLRIRDGFEEIDDIDHLGNRRVRSVGELIENQFRIGLVRVERAILERLSTVDVDAVMPHDLINSKLLVSVIRDFFATSQLSQFMDQTNPLSEITHKRRLSALGPGGLTRDRASFEVRDVHTTHYGRICPIETPEGQNIGLINSMATFARVNQLGFIESPYRRVVDGTVTDEVVYLSAILEDKYIIAQANTKFSDEGKFFEDLISCRKNGDFVMSKPKDIDFVDVSPMQVVSVAAALIPFLENDDANRALMGSNMQRQAVPLIKTEAPFVGTGIEGIVAQDSGATVIALHDGVIEQVDATRIVIRNTDLMEDNMVGVQIYNLQKFKRSNHNTCINQKPLVKVGDKVSKGDIIADGPSTDLGELALGRNVLVAFMPWNGYNFEDSILISEEIAKKDVFTSIHIEEFEVVARDTRLGPEEITRDIPNVVEESLRHIDEAGIVHVGAEIKPGDILVGKVTPKSESPMTPEEKLLRAIFGEKAADVRDSSLHVPPGVSGTVVDVQVVSRRGVDKDERTLAIERQQISSLEKDKNVELQILSGVVYSKLEAMLVGKKCISGPKGVKTDSVLTADVLEDISKGQMWQIIVDDETVMESIKSTKTGYDAAVLKLEKEFAQAVDRIKTGDDLPQGALKIVKVFIATKHKLQPGDKMAGRHGNKGVISRILPNEDMPYLPDGTIVDIVLNPLGVPSRMNVGQILETHLGWAAANLGKQVAQALESYNEGKAKVDHLRSKLTEIYGDKHSGKFVKDLTDAELVEMSTNLSKGITFATPVFDGAKEDDIVKMLELSGVDSSGQVKLIDGRTGEYFDREVTVGYIYMMKLHHLVDDKIHARSIGPYSLVTQQPLGGKSHFGGQRLGEMECWALQAYGAAYTLQEMLTVKSDDVTGRIKVYESIIRGDQNFETGIPESFNVMIKELRSLCLNFELIKQ